MKDFVSFTIGLGSLTTLCLIIIIGAIVACKPTKGAEHEVAYGNRLCGMWFSIIGTIVFTLVFTAIYNTHW